MTHLLAYLEAVTGQGPQDARLQTLACSLVRKGSMVSEGALLVGFLEEGAFSANPEEGAGRD